MAAKPLIAELDFGMGNIRSLQKAFEHFGANIKVTDSQKMAQQAQALVLPGDGAFLQAMSEIRRLGFDELIYDFVRQKKPILGICIGFQVLFEHSTEFGSADGLGIFEGTLTKFNDQNVIVPHMGWAKTKILKQSRFTQNLSGEEYFYYVHSFRWEGQHPYGIGLGDYDGVFTAMVEKENIFATQFHPEKSHDKGLQLLKNFIEIVDEFHGVGGGVSS